MSRNLFCCRPRFPPAHLFKNDFWRKRGARGKQAREKHKKTAAQGSRSGIIKCIRRIRHGQNQKDKMPRK